MADGFQYDVMVEGNWDADPVKLKNKLTIYFSSGRRSNGGDCVVQCEASDGPRATVRFKTEEVRQNVLKKKHHVIKLGDENVTLKVYLPGSVANSQKTESSVNTNQTETSDKDEKLPITESNSQEEKESGPAEVSSPCSVVIENTQAMTKELLGMLVENILKYSAELTFKVEDIPESNCAVVTFAKLKDAKEFILESPDNTMFKKKKLRTRFLEMTTKVKAEEIPSSMNATHITLYFERYGEIMGSVEMPEGEQSAIITFEEPDVVNKVLETSHCISKHLVKVFPYYDCLGTALYGEERPTLKLPDGLTEKIDTSVIKHLEKHQKALKNIKDSMAQHFCELDLKVPCVQISPIPSILQQGVKTRHLIMTWRKRASDAFNKTVSKYKSLEIKISSDVWPELEAEICKILSPEPVTLVSHEDQGTMVIAGLAEDVDRTRAIAQSAINKMTPVIQREKESITDNMAMTPSMYKITMPGGLEPEIHKHFPKLELKYHNDSGNLTFFGLRQEVLESKNNILQEIFLLKTRMVKLHPSVMEFLTKVDQEELIKEQFLSNGINASFEIKDDHVLLYAKTDKDLKNSEDQLKEQLHTSCFDVEDPNVLKKTEWKDLLSSSTCNSSVLIVISDSKVEISGLAELVKIVHEDLSDFINIHAHITESLRHNKTIIKFVKEHKQIDWHEKVKDLNVDFKDETISLSGSRHRVSYCKLLFEGLLSSVSYDKLRINKPGAKKLFMIKESMIVPTAFSRMECLLELVDERDTSQTASLTGNTVVNTPNGVKITVNKGDLCFYAVDAVVSAANDRLQLDGGLSKALSDAAGPQLQDACNQIIKSRSQLNTGDAVLTKAGGQLRCKYVIHAVGPQYNNSDPQKSVGLLKKAIINSLELANKDNCQSIAIPAISSGNFGFPLDLCAETIVAAINEFFKSLSSFCLTEIFLVDQHDKTINALNAAVKGTNQSSPKTQGSTLKASSNRPQQNPPRYTNFGPQSVTTNEGITIKLQKCNIEDTSLDVVVNSISSDLSLTHGVIAIAISKAAGNQLQTLLNQQATAPAKTGAILVTSGCNLKNKLVFHVVAPQYKQGQGSEQELENIVNGCLMEAEKQKQSSIVFPAIGTGKLGFQKTAVATLMLDCFVKFSKNRTSKHVQEVMLALQPTDTSTIQAFTDELVKKFNIQSSSASSSNEGFLKITSPKTGIYETKVGGILLQVLSGDITKETTDVIVNSTNDDFTLKSGVSKAILDSAGPNVEAECQTLGTQNNNGLIMTQQGNLQCKKIIHVSAKSSPPLVNERVFQALTISMQQNFTSVAFPAIGTGQGGADPDQVADSMLDAVVNFATKNTQSSIKLVRLVIFQAPMLNNFYQSMLKRVVTTQQKNTLAKPVFRRRNPDISQLWDKEFEMEEKVVDAALFFICGHSQNSVTKTKQWLEKLISDELASQNISDPLILSLSEKDQQRIKDLQRTFEVVVQKKSNAQGTTAADSKEVTLTVEGIATDVLKVVSEIQEMLRKNREDLELQKDIELASELVDWQYKQTGLYTSFDQKTNYHLEHAFLNNDTQVDINFQGLVYTVQLPDGSAVSSNGNQMVIRRIDKRVNEEFPEQWDMMTDDELFKVCPLPADSNEYKDVLQHFGKTCKNNVLKIERIQNSGMWKNYQNNKQVMERKNNHTNNEKMLFHGTREETKEHINKSGFNRSYAGVNATVYGKGTYFALNANYSANNTYSVPNAKGEKHMYRCRVLTGDYTTGNPQMIDAPAKSTNSSDQYDTVVDNPAQPSIFVVFRDYHAYPEHLITFT